MVIDSSAIISILMNEPDAEGSASTIESTSIRIMSAATLFDTSIVIEARHGLAGAEKLSEFIEVAQIEVMAFTPQQVEIAVNAYRSFGKGRHPASLSFGDCFSYALARSTGQSLLFKGDDFTKTDISAALTS